jgi:hypothetical protein
MAWQYDATKGEQDRRALDARLLDAQRQRDIELCIVTYRGAIRECDDLECANELFAELDARGQAQVRRALDREFQEAA